MFTPEELAIGRVSGKYKDQDIASTSLSPTRLGNIFSQAKNKYKLETISINEVINSNIGKQNRMPKRKKIDKFFKF